MSNSLEKFYHYWGKACLPEEAVPSYHLLPYHCLDVSAVGWVWLEQDPALRTRIVCSIGMDKDDKRLNSIIGFFLALHDFGKFDIRFQFRVPEVRNLVWHDLNHDDLFLSPNDITEYNHGKTGYDIFVKFYTQFLELECQDEDILDKWKPWIAAVTGHHGVIPKQTRWRNPNVEPCVIDHDHQARMEWFKSMKGRPICDDFPIWE